MPALHGRYAELNWHTYERWLRSQEAQLRNLCPREHAHVG